MYPFIRVDRGWVCSGTTEHKKAVRNGIATSDLFQKKALALLFVVGWVQAAIWHEPHWHSRLLVIIAIGINLGLYKKKEQCPWYGLTKQEVKQGVSSSSGDAGAESDVKAIKKAVSVVASSASSSSVAQTEKKRRHKDRVHGDRCTSPPIEKNDVPRSDYLVQRFSCELCSSHYRGGETSVRLAQPARQGYSI